MDKLSEAIESDYFLKEMKEGATLQTLGGSDKNQKKGRGDISGLLSSFNLHIWSPFEVNNDLRGGIGLGETLSGDPYTPDDQELLPESCTVGGKKG